MRRDNRSAKALAWCVLMSGCWAGAFWSLWFLIGIPLLLVWAARWEDGW